MASWPSETTRKPRSHQQNLRTPYVLRASHTPAALALATLTSGRLVLPGRNVALLLCGGNLDLATLPTLIEIAAQA